MLKIYIKNGQASIATRNYFNKIELLTEKVSKNIFTIFNLKEKEIFNYEIYNEEDVEKIEVEWNSNELTNNIKNIPRMVFFNVNKDIEGIVYINEEKVIFNNVYPDEISTKNLTIEEIIFS